MSSFYFDTLVVLLMSIFFRRLASLNDVSLAPLNGVHLMSNYRRSLRHVTTLLAPLIGVSFATLGRPYGDTLRRPFYTIYKK
jgi:hypothetical protein